MNLELVILDLTRTKILKINKFPKPSEQNFKGQTGVLKLGKRKERCFKNMPD